MLGSREKIIERFKVLGLMSRFKIFETLKENQTPMTFSLLVQRVGLPSGTVARQIKYLLDADLVHKQRSSVHVLYYVNYEVCLELSDFLKQGVPTDGETEGTET